MARRSAGPGPTRALLAVLAWTLALLASMAIPALAQGPPFGERPDGAHVVDDAGVLQRDPEAALEQSFAALQQSTGVDVVAYLQVKPGAREPEAVAADATALLESWGVGGPDGDGAVLMMNLGQNARGVAALIGGAGLLQRIDQASLDAIVAEAIQPSLSEEQPLAALTQGIVALSNRLGGPPPSARPGVSPAPSTTPTQAPVASPIPQPVGLPDIGPPPPAGPPFGEPVPGATVYDYAGVLSRDVVASLSRRIRRIEDLTGAEVVVYTQVKPESDTFAEAERDAIALMDQWGIGRRGFDDGLVILLDLDESREHGQAQLYAGPGFRASYMTNEDRQRIFTDEMLPYLLDADFNSAMLAAMETIEAETTPERAQSLQLARQVDAATGLVVAPLVLIGLVAWAGWSWMRYGRDPEVVDDPSVIMPAPPPGLTPAAAAVIIDGRATRHALTTALVDLAARGEIRFRESPANAEGKLEVDILRPDVRDPRLTRNRQAPLGDAEAYLLERIQSIADGAGRIDAQDLLKLGKHVEPFEDRLEKHVASEGWYREPPSRSTERWTLRAAVVLIVGVVAVVIALNLPSNGLLLLGAAVLLAAVAMFVLARVMPQRTMNGAMVFAWLAAYRRTLQKTLEASGTMDQVVAARTVPWLETADQAVVWGYALGLHEEVEDVLERSIEATKGATPGTVIYFPSWYVGGGGGTMGSAGGPSGAFSSSAMPNFAAMTAALATVGNSPASSGSGSSGGFGGGSSGGGGGGAGGGF
jgi:uncharacterized membrane protein YgcG